MRPSHRSGEIARNDESGPVVRQATMTRHVAATFTGTLRWKVVQVTPVMCQSTMMVTRPTAPVSCASGRNQRRTSTLWKVSVVTRNARTTPARISQTRVGRAEVDAVPVAAAAHEVGAGVGRHAEGDEHEHGLLAPQPLDRGQEDHGRHQVELLLDRQRPVLEHDRSVDAVEGQVVPVADVEERGDELHRQVRVGRREVEQRDDHQEEQRGVERGQQALGAPHPEARQAGVPGVVALVQQATGDEEARQHEEGRDAQPVAA